MAKAMESYCVVAARASRSELVRVVAMVCYTFTMISLRLLPHAFCERHGGGELKGANQPLVL